MWTWPGRRRRLRPARGGIAVSLAVAIGVGAAPADAEPRVVTSIKPIHSLVARVMGQVGTPRLLVDGAQSPHTYDLAPSEAHALSQADLVVWVGPALESFLTRPVRSLASDATVLRLQDADGVRRLATRTSGAWESGGHGHDHGHDGDHAHDRHGDHGDAQDHGHGESEQAKPIPADRVDPHIWLDPANAQAMVTAVAERLATVDRANAATYRANAREARKAIGALAERIDGEVAPVRDRPFVVFHDAYQYFERAFDLNAVGAISLNPDRQPGAKRLHAIRERIRELDARCVFREPQFAPDLVRTVLEGTPAREGVLDPLGADLPPGPEAYPAMMTRLGESLTACLDRD